MGRLPRFAVCGLHDLMAVHKVMNLDVVNTGRHRRRSEAENLRIIGKSFSGPWLVAAMALHNGMRVRFNDMAAT